MSGMQYVSEAQAAHLLGIGRRKFRERRDAGDPICQPDYIDPDSGRRQYNELALSAALDQLGRNKVRGAT